MSAWLIQAVNTVSIWAIPTVVVVVVVVAAARGVPVYEEFVEGARGGFETAVRIIPYLVTMLVAIGMFRACGAMGWIVRGLEPVLGALGFPPDLLPLALMRPLSGSGSNALFAELVQAHGPDSLIARMAGTLIGSTETTFYVIAVYFGAVAVRRTRHAVPAGLLADLAGIVAAVAVCRLVFGVR